MILLHEDTPPALRRLGDTVKGRLAELMGGLSPEDVGLAQDAIGSVLVNSAVT